jgi:elongation factor P
MNTETFEQIAVAAEKVGDAAKFLRENDVVEVVLYGDEVIGLELPPTVELTVVETEPGVKGDTATSATKPATLETGLVVQVPLFIDVGMRIKVNTETGEYVERVS